MPIQISIIGAGLIGLSAAIAIAPAGHDIHVYEKSSFSKEIGAALQIAPQGVKILKSWGIDLEKMQASQCHQWRKTTDLSVKPKPSPLIWDWKEVAERNGVTDHQVMIHRVDCHTTLREKALSFPNVHLHLGEGLVSLDPEAGTITLVDGSTHKTDLIIGADGTHSITADFIGGKEAIKRIAPGRYVYRCLIPTAAAMSDPMVKDWLSNWDFAGTLTGFANPQYKKYLVQYSCRHGEVINFAMFKSVPPGIHLGEGWDHPVEAGEVADVMEGYPEQFHRLIQHADDIKRFELYRRDLTTSFNNGRLAIIGDAAHPMPPTLSAGAGTGIEEAAALGVLIDKEISPGEVPERLKVWNDLRYHRGALIKLASEDLSTGTISDNSKRLIEERGDMSLENFTEKGMLDYIWPHDAIGEAKDALARFKAA